MRKPTLERWLRRELLALSGLERFSLRKLAAMAQSTHPRLVEPLFLYCVDCGREAALLELVYREDVADSYKSQMGKLSGKNLADLALSGAAQGVLPREYAKHLDSFAADYRKEEIYAASKQMRQERCRRLQLEKGVSNIEISRALGLDAGNVCAFLKRGALGRVSLSDATAMMKYLMAL